MGEIKKESLDKLLILIDEICSKDENLWFKNKISSKYGVYCIDENSQNLQLSNIENYLKLDGYKIIDYSGIKNEVVRNQLFRDCIEMSKYRLGKINDTISFDEFCRYAFLQVEELINYYYNIKFDGNITKIQELILKHNPKYRSKSDTDLNGISSLYKALGFLKEYGLNKKPMKRTIDFLRNIRNDLSHRNSYKIKSEDTILSKAAKNKIDVSNSYFDFKSANEEDKGIYNEGRFIYLKRREDYQEVIECLNFLKEAVIIVLQ
jgi:hypothetical protein